MSGQSKNDPRLMSYNAVRRAVGLVGLGLPLSLYLYARLAGDMQPSISEFYYTAMGDVLVGALSAIGIFLIAYKGYPREAGERLSDRVVATVAGLGAIGVALFPTSNKTGTTCTPQDCIQTGITGHPEWLHLDSAAVFFIAMALFCFFLFPKGNLKAGKSRLGSPANVIYFVCGTLIVVAIGAMALFWLVSEPTKLVWGQNNYIFWFETLGVVAFAVSWLTKGKIIAGLRALGVRP